MPGLQQPPKLGEPQPTSSLQHSNRRQPATKSQNTNPSDRHPVCEAPKPTPWRTDTRSPSQHSRPGMLRTRVGLESGQRMLTTAQQRKAGPDRLVAHLHRNPTRPCDGHYRLLIANTGSEYALNAVNQGVTALGIKGWSPHHHTPPTYPPRPSHPPDHHPPIPPTFPTKLLLMDSFGKLQPRTASSSRRKRSRPPRSPTPPRSPKSASSHPTSAWCTQAWGPTTAC